MKFIALDFETANADLASICQVGLVAFEDGEPVDHFAAVIDPKDYFDPINISIHGIDEARVAGAPAFADIFPELESRMAGAVVVCHSLFDRTALQRATARHGLTDISCRWLDNTRVVRRTWSEYARSGYGLANLSRAFGLTFKHHDAGEDARATGMILVRALRESGHSLDEWLVRSHQPITPLATVARTADPAGPFTGEVVAFTGALAMPRREAADLAARAGFAVEPGVTKLTTLLVVGDQDVMRLAPGQSKSSKHLKAEALIAKGNSIRILRETDFIELLAFAGA